MIPPAQILAAFALAVALPASALALAPNQSAAIDRLAADPPPGKPAASVLARHYAVLLWVEDYCNGRSSEAVRTYLLTKGAGDRDAFEAGWLDAFDMLSKTEPKAMCPLVLELYGPAGAQIPDAWTPRQ
jgi:hypothetical protein